MKVLALIFVFAFIVGCSDETTAPEDASVDTVIEAGVEASVDVVPDTVPDTKKETDTVPDVSPVDTSKDVVLTDSIEE